MIVRRRADPSPVRTGLTHAGISVFVFGCIAATFAAGVQTIGNPADAGPRVSLALFQQRDVEPVLKARLDTPDETETRRVAALALPEPSLDIDYYPGGRETASPAPTEQGDGASAGVRINGRTVLPGQSFSQVASAETATTTPEAGLRERAASDRLPKAVSADRTPMTAHARPFSNPENRPMVSVVVGGLGINRTHTQSAIDELPPEITLSFVPDASGLQRWVDSARKAGHEVLIEMPMEPYEYGRIRPHPHTLSTDNGDAENFARLEWLLSQATGYFGVTNSEGGKFAADASASGPVFAALASRGVAFVEDGSLQRSNFGQLSEAAKAPFVRALSKIDDTAEAPAIEAKLLELETQALETGGSLATGFAYPVTIDVLKAWSDRLHGKGFILAPASAQITSANAPTKVTAIGRRQTGTGDPAP